MARGLPSMTALLGLLAVAGFQNRDKIAEMLRGAHPAAAPASPAKAGSAKVASGHQADLARVARPPNPVAALVACWAVSAARPRADC